MIHLLFVIDQVFTIRKRHSQPTLVDSIRSASSTLVHQHLIEDEWSTSRIDNVKLIETVGQQRSTQRKTVECQILIGDIAFFTG